MSYQMICHHCGAPTYAVEPNDAEKRFGVVWVRVCQECGIRWSVLKAPALLGDPESVARKTGVSSIRDFAEMDEPEFDRWMSARSEDDARSIAAKLMWHYDWCRLVEEDGEWRIEYGRSKP